MIPEKSIKNQDFLIDFVDDFNVIMGLFHQADSLKKDNLSQSFIYYSNHLPHLLERLIEKIRDLTPGAQKKLIEEIIKSSAINGIQELNDILPQDSSFDAADILRNIVEKLDETRENKLFEVVKLDTAIKVKSIQEYQSIIPNMAEEDFESIKEDETFKEFIEKIKSIEDLTQNQELIRKLMLGLNEDGKSYEEIYKRYITASNAVRDTSRNIEKIRKLQTKNHDMMNSITQMIRLMQGNVYDNNQVEELRKKLH